MDAGQAVSNTGRGQALLGLGAAGAAGRVGAPQALATLRAACVGEPPSAVACGELGDRHRLGRNTPFDPMGARVFYRQACESGRGEASERACANAEAMDLLQL